MQDRVRVRLRRDEVAMLYKPRDPACHIYMLNRARDDWDLSSEDKLVHNTNGLFKAMQPGFKLERALRNLHMISDHFRDIFRFLNRNMGIDQFLQPKADVRCNLMAWNLLQWELTSIFVPEQIKLDFFDLLCVRGGASFFVFVTPGGMVTVDKIYRDSSKEKKKYLKPWMQVVFACEIRLKQYFRYGKSDYRRHPDDIGKEDFFDVWKCCVPDAFKNDRVVCNRVGDLMKFTLLTY